MLLDFGNVDSIHGWPFLFVDVCAHDSRVSLRTWWGEEAGLEACKELAKVVGSVRISRHFDKGPAQEGNRREGRPPRLFHDDIGMSSSLHVSTGADEKLRQATRRL